MAITLNEEWTVDAFAKMHRYRITSKRLAEKSGYSENYISQLMNGRKEIQSDAAMENTKKKILDALDALIEEQSAKVTEG